ncbi:MarR family winged helix-turn-helix transcriptional regulator [Hirschia baltica]|uniref:Transcriptional regulator, MarR family n=1 Tax=Hirschia baltica (strain ATCC 49814 / DSM 5838 / IFAM 1418) TaxID=582402 RepID=C6XKX1_HIRBI|nr:MarR family transcriptional regulator [Hirschia baltica]ACT57800.1 transcriptional regulator, MarR family [Hirschia baltica ATCC 49814]
MSAEEVKAEEDSTFKLSESPAHLLRRSQQLATEIFTDLGMADNVTLRQSVVLAAVAEKEGLSQSDLVNATGIDRSTLADMIARMETRGLVTRVAAEGDARAKSVSLTTLGREALDEAMPAMQTVDKALLHSLPKNKRKAFLSILTLLAGAADDDFDLAEVMGKRKKSKKKKSKKKTSGKSGKKK